MQSVIAPVLVRTTNHAIRPGQIDDDAFRVIRRLQSFGYEAFIVGGGVRDLLLGHIPKDFDIVTGARPQEVRRIFRNCRLIGRRFRLAHLLYADGKVLEVATFRAEPDLGDEDGENGLLITDDNEFGTPESDARRRDFSVNALFYDPSSNEVIDYVGGLRDVELRVLRTIGDPIVRFREDPVRMLRAVKFAARLGLRLEERERRAIRSERVELRKAAVPRLIEEVLRMLWSGAAAASYALLEDLYLLELLLPEVSAWLARGPGNPAAKLEASLSALDRARIGKPTRNNGILLAPLFWPMYRDLLAASGRRPEAHHLRQVAEALVGPTAVRLRVPRKDVAALIGILEMQERFDAASRKKMWRMSLARSPHFADAVALLEMRQRAEDLDPVAVEEWKSLIGVVPTEEDEDGGRSGGRDRRRRRGGRRRAGGR